jgi:hypothetical protein
VTSRTLEKITVVIAVAVLGMAPAVGIGELRAAPAILLVAALVVTVSAGMDLVLRGEARYRPTADLFILPGALVVAGALFIPLLPSGGAIAAGLAGFGALLFVVFWAEHRLRVGGADHRMPAMALTLTGYVAAFVLYAAIYQAKTRSLISAPAIVLVTMLLAARQLRLAQEAQVAEALGAAGAVPEPNHAELVGAAAAAGPPALLTAVAPSSTGERAGDLETARAATASTGRTSTELRALRMGARQQHALMPGWPRTLVYASVVALAAGEVTWALNYWPLNGLFGGAFLLSVFYFLVGVLRDHLQSRLTLRTLVEYGAVCAIGAVLIGVAGLLRTPS